MKSDAFREPSNAHLGGRRMIHRPSPWPRPRLLSGRCPVCGWWFDGYAVGVGEPTTDTAPVVEWAVDARHAGHCLKRECYFRNNCQSPKLETPGVVRPQRRRRRAG